MESLGVTSPVTDYSKQITDKSNIIRLLVIGAGLIGSRHVKMIQTRHDCKLVGVVDPNTETHTDSSVHYYDRMSSVDNPVDGVIIATPTERHHHDGIIAAGRGWHMLIEKPVTATSDQAEELRKAVEMYGVKCLVGHHRRYHASIAKLRELIKTGSIGTPITSTLIWAMRKPDSYFKSSWRRINGSPVMINLIHDIDMLRYVVGEIRHITGVSSSMIRQQRRLESGAIALGFASGCSGTISFADTAPSPWGFESATDENPNIASTQQDMWWITGTEGSVAYPSLTVWAGAADWSQAPQPEQIKTEITTPLAAQLDHFISIIRAEAEPLIDISDAQESLRITRSLEELLYEHQGNEVI